MAIYRTIQMTFWTDSKVVDDFTPEDRYFYLYLMTNPHTNLAGCYEISMKQASDETGYNKEVIASLLERFERVHNIIRYSKATKEILLLNWWKFNWTKSPKLQKPLAEGIAAVKNKDFRTFLEHQVERMMNGDTDSISIPYQYGSDTTVTVTVTDTVTDSVPVTDTNAVNGKGGMGEKPKPKELREEFETLWGIYPKKQGGKDKAFGYYKRARESGTTYEEVGDGIHAYIDYIQANEVDIQYVKMGTTFFSQKAWQDDWTIRTRGSNNFDRIFAEIFEEHKDDI